MNETVTRAIKTAKAAAKAWRTAATGEMNPDLAAKAVKRADAWEAEAEALAALIAGGFRVMTVDV